jgi:methionyl-tRNA formyltransferase
VAGADLLIETLRGVEAGTVRPEPQDHSQATLAPILKREDGLIHWDFPAHVILNRMRGFVPWPGTYTLFRGHRFHIWQAREVAGGPPQGILEKRGRTLVAGCGNGTALELVEVQLEGRKRMDAQSFANGNPIDQPEHLGDLPR